MTESRPHASRKYLRFLWTGGSSALLNLGLLHVLVSSGGLSEGWELDLANVLALEVGILYSFFLCRFWVFSAAPAQGPFWRELAAFHGAVAVAATFRVILFAVLRPAGVPVLLNAAIGIALAAVLSFVLYERLVFSRR